MNRRQQHEIAAVVAAEIMRGPRSLKALCLALGLRDRSTDIPRKYVDSFKAQGLIYVHSWYHNRNELWAWQPQPFFLPDAPKPLTAAERAARDAELRRLEAENRDKPLKRRPMPPPTAANSVFSLGVMG